MNGEDSTKHIDRRDKETMMPTVSPVIPAMITVHLGPPSSAARNVTLPFWSYIANVASSEIYPNWPESALRANIYAQVSFALNRVYTEYYRSRGYDFDITNSTAFDQYFVEGRDIFENINELAGELFNSYVVRRGSIEPLFTQYCNGTTVTCGGLSQWGTVELAERGLTPYEILQYYYGEDIDIITNVPVENVRASAPAVPLRLGSGGNDVRNLQIRLNRISKNYPAIPKIVLTDGLFSTDTEDAVIEFQRIARLTTDGVVGNATWYAIIFYFNAVKRLNELNSEGLLITEVSQDFPSQLGEGTRGQSVRNLQYYISYLSRYYPGIPSVTVDGIFGNETAAAVIDAQNTFGLTADGIVGPVTWQSIYNAYLGIIRTIPLEYIEGSAVPFGGTPLRLGSEGEAVVLLQRYLGRISETLSEIPSVPTSGYFGELTDNAVRIFQEFYGLPVTGVVNIETWDAIAGVFEDVTAGDELADGQYPGYSIS